MTRVSIFVLCLFSCASNTHSPENVALKTFEIHGAEIELPETYSIEYPDTVNWPHRGFLIKDGCYKIGFNGGGIGYLPSLEEMVVEDGKKLEYDTINEFVRIITYSTDSTTDISLDIFELTKQESTPFDLIEFESDNRNYHVIGMSTYENGVKICLTKEDQKELLAAFLNLKLK